MRVLFVPTLTKMSFMNLFITLGVAGQANLTKERLKNSTSRETLNEIIAKQEGGC